MSFRLKITLSMICLTALLFGIGGSLLVSYVFEESFRAEQASAYESYRWVMGTVGIANEITPHPDVAAVEDTLRQLSSKLNSDRMSLALYSAGSHDPLFASGIAPTPPELEPASGQCVLTFEDLDGSGQVILASGTMETGDVPLMLSIANNVTYLFEERDALTRAFQIVFAIAIALSALFSFLMASLLTRPLRQLSSATRAIAKGEFAERVDVTSSDEVGRLAVDFNTMAASLERGVRAMSETMDSQNRFIGSFAHEVKTPITSIIGYAELASTDTLDSAELQEAYGFIASEGRRLERLSRKLLQLQLIQKGTVDLKPYSPAEIARTTVDSTRPLFERKGIAIAFEGESGTCMLEPDLFVTMLTNLLENARRAFDGYDEGDPRIDVRVEVDEDGCTLSVEDNGRGIPEDSLDRLTDAFYRVDKSRSRKAGGAGLGLSLCLEIAHAHDGTIEVQSAPNEGTLVIVRLNGGTLR